MKGFYKRLMLLIILVVSISGAVIYFTVDINTLANLTVFKPWSIGLAILFMSLGVFLDGTRLMHLVKMSKEKISFFQAIQVVFGNYFAALLTPGATGGAVAQLMFLRRAGIPTGKATAFVFLRTVISILFLIFCLPIIFLHDATVIPGISNNSLMAVSLVAFIIIIFLILAVNFHALDKFAIYISRKLSYKKRRSFIKGYRDTCFAVRLFFSAPFSMVRIFFESGFSLLATYAVVPCLIVGLGVEADWYTVMGRMIFLNMLLYFMPTPGGAGIAEGGFVLCFTSTVPAGTVGIVAVCWRLIAEYIPFLIGFYYTVTVFGNDYLNGNS